jgi:predicted transglutaminase-like cysteine proteinase
LTPPLGQFTRRIVLIFLLTASTAISQGLGLTEDVLKWFEQKYGTPARQRLQQLQFLIKANADAPERTQLRKINDYFNTIPYRRDAALWRQRDHWATPFELIGTQGGDCEDYAIAKYFALREMGIAERKLRISYVKSVKLNQAHMVLAYYPDRNADPLILDNIEKKIRPAAQRTDLIPVYSFNGDNLWQAVSRLQGVKVGNSSRLHLWNELRRKMEVEKNH